MSMSWGSAIVYGPWKEIPDLQLDAVKKVSHHLLVRTRQI